MYLYYIQGAPDWVVEATCLTLAYVALCEVRYFNC